MIRRLVALLVSLACCFALAACGGGNDDTKSSGPGIPDYAKSNDEQGAQRFVQYWIDTLNQATTSGDTAKLKTLSKGSCEVCTDFAKRLDDIYAAGGHVETDGFTVKKLVNEAGVPAPGAGVSAVLHATPQTVVEKKGAKVRKLKGGDLRMRLIMVRSGDHWLMDRVDPG